MHRDRRPTSRGARSRRSSRRCCEPNSRPGRRARARVVRRRRPVRRGPPSRSERPPRPSLRPPLPRTSRSGGHRPARLRPGDRLGRSGRARDRGQAEAADLDPSLDIDRLGLSRIGRACDRRFRGQAEAAHIDPQGSVVGGRVCRSERDRDRGQAEAPDDDPQGRRRLSRPDDGAPDPRTGVRERRHPRVRDRRDAPRRAAGRARRDGQDDPGPRPRGNPPVHCLGARGSTVRNVSRLPDGGLRKPPRRSSPSARWARRPGRHRRRPNADLGSRPHAGRGRSSDRHRRRGPSTDRGRPACDPQDPRGAAAGSDDRPVRR